IGTGRGHSVLDVIDTFQKISGIKLNYKMGSRRIGDIDQIWADVHKAEKELNWKAELDLKAMLTSAWSWEKRINKQAT
ncbi:unnamed protein product, partial [Adineta steineri]